MQYLLEAFSSVFDHFGILCIEGLIGTCLLVLWTAMLKAKKRLRKNVFFWVNTCAFWKYISNWTQQINVLWKIAVDSLWKITLPTKNTKFQTIQQSLSMFCLKSTLKDTALGKFKCENNKTWAKCFKCQKYPGVF